MLNVKVEIGESEVIEQLEENPTVGQNLKSINLVDKS